MSTVPSSLRLRTDLKERLSAQAQVSGMTTHAYMVGALETQLRRDEQRRQFHEDAKAAKANVIATNLAYDGAHVSAWLQARARGESPELPIPVPWRE